MKRTREAFSGAPASGAAASATALTFTSSNAPALMTQVIIIAPKTSANVNYKLALIDDNSVKVYETGSVASSGVGSISMSASVFPGDILQVHTSADHTTPKVMTCSGSVHLEV